MEQLRREREAKVPDEPHIEEDHVVVCVKHLRGGIVTRAFYPNSVMQVVYDWIGSLQSDLSHFALFVMTSTQSKTLIYPTQEIVPQTMLYMEQTDDPVLRSASFLVSIHGINIFSHVMVVYHATLSYKCAVLNFSVNVSVNILCQ